MTTDRPLPKQAPTIDPDELAAAVGRFEAWLAFAATNQPGLDHIHQVSYERYPIGDDDLKLLLADYRYHRPTQWAYDQACAALHKRPTHTEHERALAELDYARRIARHLATALTTYGGEIEGVAELDVLLVAWGNWPGDPLPDWLTAVPADAEEAKQP